MTSREAAPAEHPEEDAAEAGAPAPSLPPWAAFAYYDFTMLWLGGLASLVTMQLRTLVSFQWLYEETGSAAQLGLLGAVQLLQMPVVLYGGALADNLDRKKLMASTQAFAFAMLVALTVLAYAGGLQPWHIFAVTGISAGLSGNSGGLQSGLQSTGGRARLLPVADDLGI